MSWNEEIRRINMEAGNLWVALRKLRIDHESIQKRLLPADGLAGEVLEKASSSDFSFTWGVGGGGGDYHIDGGAANNIYLPIQKVDGGGA